MAESGRTEINVSKEAFDFICTACERENKTVEAVIYCEECKDYCCQQCTDLHKKVSLLFGHNFLNVGHGSQSGNQASSSPEFPTERCCKHTGKVIDMYCQIHDSVGCHKCIATDHRWCPDSKIYSIPVSLNILIKLSERIEPEKFLKQTMTSVSKLSELKDKQLESLRESKETALEQVCTFQKALEGMIRHAADRSRTEIEEAFKNVKKEILEDKWNIDGNNNLLKDANDKLTKPVFNRAQRFVCSKLAKESILDVCMAMNQQQTGDYNHVEIIFHPENALIDNIQGLNGIGQVQIDRKKRIDLYKLKGTHDTNIKVADDTKDVISFGCCLISDKQLLVSDRNNQKLKRVDVETMALIDHCSLSCSTLGICLVNDKEVAVACKNPNKIQFVSIEHEMLPTRKIDTAYPCFCIAMKNDNFYVTDGNSSLFVYDMSGTLLRTIINDNAGRKLFSYCSHITVNKFGNRMFVGDYSRGILCFNECDIYQSTIYMCGVKGNGGMCSDGRGNIFVGGHNLNNVVQFNENRKWIGDVLNQADGLNKPLSIAFSPKYNRLFVTSSSNKLKVFDLE